MSQKPPSHHNSGHTSEPVSVNLPTMLIPRLAEHLGRIGSTRAAYITRLIEMDLERHEYAAPTTQGRR